MRNIRTVFVLSASLLACHAEVQGSAGTNGGYAPPQPYYGQPSAAGNAPGYAPPSAGPQSGGPPPNGAAGEPPTWGIPRGSGWTLREREQWKNISDSFTGGTPNVDVRLGGPSSLLEITQRQCNTVFAGGFVFDTFHGRFIPTENFGDAELEGYLRAPLAALQQVCSHGAMQRDAVRKKVQRIEVRWADGGRSSWVLRDGVLTAYVSPLADRAHRSFDGASYRESIVAGLPNFL